EQRDRDGEDAVRERLEASLAHLAQATTLPGQREHARLEVEQRALALETAAVAGEAPVGADDAMARHDDRDRVAAVGVADGARVEDPAQRARAVEAVDRRPAAGERERARALVRPSEPELVRIQLSL